VAGARAKKPKNPYFLQGPFERPGLGRGGAGARAKKQKDPCFLQGPFERPRYRPGPSPRTQPFPSSAFESASLTRAELSQRDPVVVYWPSLFLEAWGTKAEKPQFYKKILFFWLAASPRPAWRFYNGRLLKLGPSLLTIA
jgi:hypothetical protein